MRLQTLLAKVRFAECGHSCPQQGGAHGDGDIFKRIPSGTFGQFAVFLRGHVAADKNVRTPSASEIMLKLESAQ